MILKTIKDLPASASADVLHIAITVVTIVSIARTANVLSALS
jgi:hypothetical protein